MILQSEDSLNALLTSLPIQLNSFCKSFAITNFKINLTRDCDVLPPRIESRFICTNEYINQLLLHKINIEENNEHILLPYIDIFKVIIYKSNNN